MTLLFSLLITTAMTLSAQKTETRTVALSNSYDAIHVSGTQNVHFEIGPAGEPLTVIGHPDDLDNMEISVKNNTLTIAIKKGYRSKTRQSIEIYARNPILKGASISGTGNIDIAGKLDGGENKFSVSGTGSISIEKLDCKTATFSISGTGSIDCPVVKADNLTTSVSGTGSVKIAQVDSNEIKIKSSGTGRVAMSGKVKDVTMTTSGTGKIDAENLTAVNVKAVSSGTGSIYCYCSGDFDGKVSGTGRIHLSGNPATVKFNGNSNKLVRK